MTVGELIDALSDFDPETPIMVGNDRRSYGWYTYGSITMRDIEEKMVPLNFFRGNKGYLINLAHVDGVKDNCAVIKGELLSLSRARRKEFMEALTQYWGEVIK